MTVTTKPSITVTAKTRKRCKACSRMVEVGEEAVLTDDRFMFQREWVYSRSYKRGAFHLWHPECHAGMKP